MALGYVNPVLAGRRSEYIRKSRWKYNIYRELYGEDYSGLLDMVRGAVKWVKGKVSSTPVSPQAKRVVPETAERVAERMPVLRRGSRGRYVEILQRLLNKIGYSLTVDGIFGRNTERAVKSFQQRSGLVTDGIVGVRTWTALFKVAGIPKIPTAPVRVPSPAPPSPPSPQPPPQQPPPVPRRPPSPSFSPETRAPAQVKAGLMDLLVRNWIWIAVAGAMLVTTVILVKRK